MLLQFDGVSIVTTATCGDGCWHAREDVCRCSCGGRNHGILCRGGAMPKRTSRADQSLYELVAVIPGRGEGEAWIDAIKRTDAAVLQVTAERFPDLDSFAYGGYGRAGKLRPVLDRKVSASQAKWPEVQAVPGAYRLVWALPAGSSYAKRSERPSYR